MARRCLLFHCCERSTKKPQQRVADRLTMAVYAAGGETKTNRFLLCGGDTSSLLTNDGI